MSGVLPDGYAGGGIAHVGALAHDGPGREDIHDISVPPESFVVPADIVSAIGQGNTANGFAALERMFPTKGVNRKAGGSVPIVAASGEFVIAPEHVRRIGGGDLRKGHKALREMVLHGRKENIRTLRKLPGPARK